MSGIHKFQSICTRSLFCFSEALARPSRSRLAVACAVLVLLMISMVPGFAYAQAGSIRIVSDSGSRAEYRAFRIATVEGLPSNDVFDWPALSGVTPPPRLA